MAVSLGARSPHLRGRAVWRRHLPSPFKLCCLVMNSIVLHRMNFRDLAVGVFTEVEETSQLIIFKPR